MTTKFYHYFGLFILPCHCSTVPFRGFLGFIHTAPHLHKPHFATCWLMASFSLVWSASWLTNSIASLIVSTFKIYLKYKYYLPISLFSPYSTHIFSHLGCKNKLQNGLLTHFAPLYILERMTFLRCKYDYSLLPLKTWPLLPWQRGKMLRSNILTISFSAPLPLLIYLASSPIFLLITYSAPLTWVFLLFFRRLRISLPQHRCNRSASFRSSLGLFIHACQDVLLKFEPFKNFPLWFFIIL